jgi:polysaccharide biosynthesis transport protein
MRTLETRNAASASLSQLPIQPARSIQTLPYETPSPVGSGRSIERLSNIIGLQKWKILAFMLLAMAVAAGIQLVIPKTYEASSLVKVDRHSASGVVGQEAAQVSSIDDMDQIITTLMELAQSDPVVRPITEKYDLLKAEKQLGGLSSAEIEKKRAAPIVLKKLTVTRPPNSYLIRIAYRATDPTLAAAVANGIAQSLSAHANDTWNRSYTEVSALVVQDMGALRAKMENSTKTLAEYEQKLGMVDPQQRATVLSSRYSQLNTEFTAAQEERLRREAVLAAILGSRSLAAAQAADGAAQSSLLSEAIQKEEAIRQQFAGIRAFYGENHPEYKKAAKEVDEVEAEIAELRQNTRDRAEAEYRQALGRESRLKELLDSTRKDVNDLNGQALQYEQLRSEAESDRKLYQDLADRTRVADLNKQFQNATVQVAAGALPPQAPIFPKLPIDLAVAFVLSGVLGVLGAVLMKAVDATFSTPEEAASELDIDILTTIPATKELPQVGASSAVFKSYGMTSISKRDALLAFYFAEAIRTLRACVSLVMAQRPLRTILVTSATPLEGKSTTVTYLAAACAHIGRKTLVIDADLRHPTQHKNLRVSNKLGLSDVLRGSAGLPEAIEKLDHGNLSVLSAGTVPHNATDLISMRFPAILEAASREFDLVIIDAPPMLGVSETRELSSLADGVIVVTRANATSGRVVSEALASLTRAHANVIGLVMNHVKLTQFSDYRYANYWAEPSAMPQKP